MVHHHPNPFAGSLGKMSLSRGVRLAIKPQNSVARRVKKSEKRAPRPVKFYPSLAGKWSAHSASMRSCAALKEKTDRVWLGRVQRRRTPHSLREVERARARCSFYASRRGRKVKIGTGRYWLESVNSNGMEFKHSDRERELMSNFYRLACFSAGLASRKLRSAAGMLWQVLLVSNKRSGRTTQEMNAIRCSFGATELSESLVYWAGWRREGCRSACRNKWNCVW